MPLFQRGPMGGIQGPLEQFKRKMYTYALLAAAFFFIVGFILGALIF